MQFGDAEFWMWTGFTLVFFILMFIPSKQHISSGGNSAKRINTVEKKPAHELIDNDAVEVLVCLGYPKREAKERVIAAFVPGMGTQDVVKKAMRVAI